MSLSSSDVWQRLAQEAVADEHEIQQWTAQVAKGLDSSQLDHGLKVLQRLVELKKLTPYQAKVVAGQSTGPLRLGAASVLQPVADPLWPGWWLARPSERMDGQAVLWACSVDEQRLESLRAAAPSLSRSMRLAAIKHDALQRTYLPEQLPSRLILRVAPVPGNTLSEKLAGETCTGPQALKIVRQIVDGLAVLHQHGITHGRVLPDRVYWQQDRVVLAVDPLCGVTCRPSDLASAGKFAVDRTAADPSRGLLAQRLGPDQELQWQAPELQITGQLPTPATDVYAVGCLWWWLLTGRPPASGNSAAEIWQQHSAPLPPLPTGCEIPAGEWRCLQHALARNPSARFASAEALSRAVEAIAAPAGQPARRQAVDVDPIAKLAGASFETAPQTSKISRVKPLSLSATIGEDRSPGPSPVARRRRRRRPGWLVPVLASCGLLAVLLIGLGLSGALQRSDSPVRDDTDLRHTASLDRADTAVKSKVDPREAAFRIVADDQFLWVPPALPTPLPLNLLPPGGQLFISFRPAALLDDSGAARRLLANFDQELSPLLGRVSKLAGLPLEEIAQVTATFYPPLTAGGLPAVCLRVELLEARPLGELKEIWRSKAGGVELDLQEIAGHSLLFSSPERSYYVTPQPLLDSQSIRQFSVGPLELMRDAAELGGEAGPLVPQLERLWSSSDGAADLSLFAATPFLLSEGSELMALGPPRLSELLMWLLPADLRGVGLQMRCEPTWYVEARFIGADALTAGKLATKYQQYLNRLPTEVESELVSQTPDSYWRALALRFPHMLRSFAEHTRAGVENGTAILNTYLPSEAASNILLSSWIALHDFASSSPSTGKPSESLATASSGPVDIEAYLERPIRLSFDQEPIEVALGLVAAEANDQLPAASTPLRFTLDGDAFEKAGITRNQQLRDFRLEGQSVRQALTEIARRGNPIANVADTSHTDQRLVWVVAPDVQQPSQSMILLTTRAAAQAAGIQLPAEFVSSREP